MADEADLASVEEARMLNMGVAVARMQLLQAAGQPKGELGTCLYCLEKCEPDAKLHDYCVEDYTLEQNQLRNSGRTRR